MDNSTSQSPEHKARQFPRYTADVRLSVQVFRKGETVSLWGRSNELAEDGVGGTLTGPLEPGEVVSMEFAIPLAVERLKVRAVVRYRSGLRHGFEFLALTDKQREALRRACEMLSQRT